jgi:hypothetical protein
MIRLVTIQRARRAGKPLPHPVELSDSFREQSNLLRGPARDRSFVPAHLPREHTNRPSAIRNGSGCTPAAFVATALRQR